MSESPISAQPNIPVPIRCLIEPRDYPDKEIDYKSTLGATSSAESGGTIRFRSSELGQTGVVTASLVADPTVTVEMEVNVVENRIPLESLKLTLEDTQPVNTWVPVEISYNPSNATLKHVNPMLDTQVETRYRQGRWEVMSEEAGDFNVAFLCTQASMVFDKKIVTFK